MRPVSWLKLSVSRCNLSRALSPGGIGPDSWLLLRVSTCRSAREVSWSGTGPHSWFLLRSNSSSLARVPKSGEMVPVNWRSDRSSAVTRGGEPSTVMPSQSAIRRSVLQFRVALPVSVSLACSSAAQSAARPGLSCGLGTATPDLGVAAGLVVAVSSGDEDVAGCEADFASSFLLGRREPMPASTTNPAMMTPMVAPTTRGHAGDVVGGIAVGSGVAGVRVAMVGAAVDDCLAVSVTICFGVAT